MLRSIHRMAAVVSSCVLLGLLVTTGLQADREIKVFNGMPDDVSLGSWGSGKAEHITDDVYVSSDEDEAGCLKIESNGLYAGGRLDLKTPIPVADLLANPKGVYIEAYVKRFQRKQPKVAATTPGAAGTGGPGSMMAPEGMMPGAPMMPGGALPGSGPPGAEGAAPAGPMMMPGMPMPGMAPGAGMPMAPAGEGAMAMPGMAPGAGMPGMPMQPGMAPGAAMPGMPMQPGVPGMPGTPGMPMEPGMPGMAPGAGMPGMPMQPGEPGMPGMPGMEGMPGMPGMTGPSGAVPKPKIVKSIEKVRIILVTDGGTIDTGTVDLTTLQPDPNKWLRVDVSLADTDKAGSVARGAVKSIAIAGDADDFFYVGAVRLLFEDQPLVANAGENMEVRAGTPIKFTAQPQPNDGRARYAWDFDDLNGLQEDALGQETEHEFKEAGHYTVTLTVSDPEGVKVPRMDKVSVLVTE